MGLGQQREINIFQRIAKARKNLAKYSRPNDKTPKGTTQYREVKVGLLARLKQRLTQTNQQVTHLCHKRVVAVLGDLDAFLPRMTWEAHRQSMTFI
jgi:hypothetical protein